MELFAAAVEFIFGDDAESVTEAVDGFIAAMPLALLSGGPDDPGVLCAHSLPNARKMTHFDPAVLDRTLDAEDFVAPNGPAYLMTWGRAYSDEQIEELAGAWGAKLVLLGHRHVETGAERFGRRLIVLNSDHEHGAVLPLDLGRLPEPDEAMLGVIPLRAI